MDGLERWRILRLHVEDQVPLAALARESGIGTRTLQRWHQLYKKHGLAGLDDSARRDKGRRRAHPATITTIERLALTRPRPSIATLHRLTVEECLRDSRPAPSYATVRQIVQALDPALVTLALEGPASYRDRHELVFRRRAERPNQIWQADHTELDILIIGANGKPERPWLTTVMDDYSRSICGYMVFTGAPSSLNTALALRQAIWRKTDPAWAMCGIPDVLHVDHGSDFTSHHLERTAVELHLRLIFSTVGRPQGRGKIERFFGTINTEVLQTLPATSAPATAALSQCSTSPVRTGRSAPSSPPYNQRTHRELGVSPRDAWVADGWMPRMPDTLDQLDGLLLTVPHASDRASRRHPLSGSALPRAHSRPVRRTRRHHPLRPPRRLRDPRLRPRHFVCVAVDEAHPNIRLSLRDIEAARRARRHELRRIINDRIPTVAHREEPRLADPAQRRKRLRTYEEE